MTDVELSSKNIFTTQPNQNNYVTIAAVVASQLPLANIFNGQTYLKDLITNILTKAQSDNQAIAFSTI